MNVFDLTGQTIAQYTVGELLGKGAMGVVYSAWQENPAQKFAFKVLPPEMHSEEEYFKRFRREAHTAHALKHPHIVPIYDYGTHELGKMELSYIVMHLLTGGSLAERLKPKENGQSAGISADEVITLTHQLSKALDYAHKNGVVHRDIKPANVMLDEQKTPFIVDFGIAKLQDATRYTQSNATLGTPAYMAPEQWTATADALPATDQYALGIMIYELLCGQLPFKATTSFQFAYKHMHEMPTSVLEFRPDLLVQVDDVLLRALDKDPANRYPNVAEFAQELENALRSDNKRNNFIIVSQEAAPAQARKIQHLPKKDAGFERSKTYDILPLPFTWMKIPAGEVTLGMGGYITGFSETFNVPAFSMAKYPITNAQFAKFVEADGYWQKKYWLEAGWQLKEKENWATPHCWQDNKWNGKDYPIVGVTWYEAIAFCNWLSEVSGESIMLPTEHQWQRAAQGEDGRAYPWGNEWDNDRCNNGVGKDWRQNTTSPVTRYENVGDSPYGVVDMVGNVWEWCLTTYDSGTNELKPTHSRVMRGGSWGNYVTSVLTVEHRCGYPPESWNVFRGFRIVKN